VRGRGVSLRNHLIQSPSFAPVENEAKRFFPRFPGKWDLWSDVNQSKMRDMVLTPESKKAVV
jgi:hypothetical protein